MNDPFNNPQHSQHNAAANQGQQQHTTDFPGLPQDIKHGDRIQVTDETTGHTFTGTVLQYSDGSNGYEDLRIRDDNTQEEKPLSKSMKVTKL